MKYRIVPATPPAHLTPFGCEVYMDMIAGYPEIDGIPPLTAEQVFNHIKHGDEAHQKWLRDELDALWHVACAKGE